MHTNLIIKLLVLPDLAATDTDNNILIGHLKVNDGDYHIMQNSLRDAVGVLEDYYDKI